MGKGTEVEVREWMRKWGEKGSRAKGDRKEEGLGGKGQRGGGKRAGK